MYVTRISVATPPLWRHFQANARHVFFWYHSTLLASSYVKRIFCATTPTQGHLVPNALHVFFGILSRHRIPFIQSSLRDAHFACNAVLVAAFSDQRASRIFGITVGGGVPVKKNTGGMGVPCKKISGWGEPPRCRVPIPATASPVAARLWVCLSPCGCAVVGLAGTGGFLRCAFFCYTPLRESQSTFFPLLHPPPPLFARCPSLLSALCSRCSRARSIARSLDRSLARYNLLTRGLSK